MMIKQVIIIYLLSLCAVSASAAAPNFIVFLTDDQGWGDLGCYGHPEIKSPNLDQFAKEGVRFTQCYSSCGVCSPSRSSILTGRTPYRNGVWRWIPSGHEVHLRTSEITIAELLKEKGYDTCHAGKWHLNGHFNSDKHPQPGDHGYDHWLATQNNASPNHMNPVNYVRNGEAVGRMEGPSSSIAATEAIEWLKNRPDQDKPFFITVWTHEPHLPIKSAERFMEPYKHLDDVGLREHHGNITQLDHAFGILMKGIDDLKLRDNTCVFYTSDNGPEGAGTKGLTRGSTGGLRGRKRADFEGGIRVPGIVRFPSYFKEAHIKPGSESNVPVIGSDIFTTICALTETPLPADRTIDGANMLPALEGKPITRSQPLYWRTHIAPAECRVALRVDDWKIVANEDMTAFFLFNMAEDKEETTDLQKKMPEKFQEMKALLIKHDAEVKAEGPDWWKNETEKKPKATKSSKRKKATALPDGKDETGSFDLVKGGTTSKGGLGTLLTTTAEAFALQQLDSPIKDEVTFSVSYQAGVSTTTRNAMLVFGSSPTNNDLFKVGTAIGMNAHVGFAGDWGNVNTGAKTSARFDSAEVFKLEARINLKTGECIATVNGVGIDAELPEDLKSISYIGIYCKNTTSSFSEIKIER
jgi:arylsulfatase A